MIEIYNNAFNRLLGERIEISSITDCKRLVRSALISEFLLHYPQKIVASKLNTSVPNVSVFAKDVPDMKEENRETNWVIRAALHDMMSDEFLHLATAENKFCRFICENLIEEHDFNVGSAAKSLGVSLSTVKKYASSFISSNIDDITGLNELKSKNKKKKKKKKNWWER